MYTACLGWTLFLASTNVTIRSAGAELPPVSELTDLVTDFHPSQYGKCDGHGRLLFQELYKDGFPVGWHNTDVYFPRGKGKSLKLTRDVSAINAFLAAEVYRPQTVRTFIKEYLTFFLRCNLGDDPSIITSRAVELGQGSNPRKRDPQFQRSETRRIRERMRPYACESDPVVRGNGWTVDMNVLTDEGAVEHWLVRGRVSPFRLDSFLCEPREPQGTFHPYIRTR